tara:strand:- start:262 stop:513 length:252 start_codon:yes stop_codon:yes gene_type:complete
MFKVFLALFISVILFIQPITKVNSYPEDQLIECLLAAKANPALLGLPETSISNFCDCALTAIIDDEKDDKASAKMCIRRYLNK